MEIIFPLIRSNDPRFIYRYIKEIRGYGKYANHYEKIIRIGFFISGSRKLNGEGELIDYKNNITITNAVFQEDNPINRNFKIVSEQPYYINKNATFPSKKRCYYGTATKKIYINNISKSILYILIKFVIDNGKLVEYNIVDNIENIYDKTKFNSVLFSDIFNDRWCLDTYPDINQYSVS